MDEMQITHEGIRLSVYRPVKINYGTSRELICNAIITFHSREEVRKFAYALLAKSEEMAP